MFKRMFLGSMCLFSVLGYAHNPESISYSMHTKELMLQFAALKNTEPKKSQNIDLFFVPAQNEIVSPGSNEWHQIKEYINALRQYQVTDNFKLQLSSFKSSPLDMEQIQILSIDALFLPRFIQEVEISKGYGVSFKLKFE